MALHEMTLEQLKAEVEKGGMVAGMRALRELKSNKEST